PAPAPTPDGVAAKAAKPAAKAPAAVSDKPPAPKPPPSEATTARQGDATVPEDDVEALAAAAFADEPAKAEEAPTSVKFECDYCGNPMEVSADLAGKRAQCPECRRIVKVPELVKRAPKQWHRNAQQEAAPEGTWDAGAKTRVSEEALEEAGARPEDREPLTLRQKLTRGAVAAAGVGLVVWGVLLAVAWSRPTHPA